MKRRMINTLLAVCLATGMVVGALPTTALETRAAVSAETVKDGLVIWESEVNKLLTEDLELPTEVSGVAGATVAYSVPESAAKYAKVEGNKLKITRPLAGEKDFKFTLKATITVPEGIEGVANGKVEKNFPMNIRAGLTEDSYAGYVYVCFADQDPVGNGAKDDYRDVQQVHFFLSEDGMNWKALNGCNPIFETGTDYTDLIEKYSETSYNYKVSKGADIEQTTTGDASVLFPFEGEDQGIRDPYLIRGCRKDGSDSNKVWLLATDLNTMSEKYGGSRTTNKVGNWGTMTSGGKGSRKLFIWETEDWVHWTRRYKDVATEADAYMAWAPEAIYNPEKDNYLVYWSARSKVDGGTRDRLYCNETKDFIEFGETKLAEQEPFYLNWKTKEPGKLHDGYGNIDTSQLWVADGDNPYGTLIRLVKDETNNHVQLMKADSVLDPKFEGKRNQAAYDNTDPTNITPFELGGKTYSTVADFQGMSDTKDLKRAEIVWNWFKDEAVADHFEYVEQKGIESQTLGYEGPTLFKFIDRDEWCVMIDNYGDMSVRYEPYLTTDLTEPNSIKKAAEGTYGREGGDVGCHGGMIPITVKEYNAMIDAYNSDPTVDNWHKIDYITWVDTYAAEQIVKSEGENSDYTSGAKAQMEKLLSQMEEATSTKELDLYQKRMNRLLTNKRIKAPTTMNASYVGFEEESVTLCTKAVDGLKTSEKLVAEADLESETSKITYASSNANVAAIDPKTGVVTAKAQGDAEITATAPGGAKAVCKVTVKGIPNKVTVKKKSVSLKVKKTFQIKASVPKGTICSKFKYKSNKPKIASVSADGKITAKKKGTAKITVTASSNKKAKATVTVKVK